jgi:hypothetical protein
LKIGEGYKLNKFDYILEKIATADFRSDPFRHLYIPDLFVREHFLEMIESPEVNIRPTQSDEELISELHRMNFKEIEFAGTTTDIPTYLEWHKNPKTEKNINQETCDGFGVVLRLQRTNAGSILTDITEFFKSTSFLETLSKKFNINLNEVSPDFGLQKYLDGYEISPHPDIRGKALTFMININPGKNSEGLDFHTHYARFKPKWQYIQEYWRQNPETDRCWVPWDWVETHKQQTKNNSIIIFSPADDTLHAVKASYDHLVTQRTQFYGNLWFRELNAKPGTGWRDLERLRGSGRDHCVGPLGVGASRGALHEESTLIAELEERNAELQRICDERLEVIEGLKRTCDERLEVIDGLKRTCDERLALIKQLHMTDPQSLH